VPARDRGTTSKSDWSTRFHVKKRQVTSGCP
jgi:hypothetical protein